MNKLGIHARLAVTLAALSFGIGLIAFFAVMFCSKAVITSIQVEALTKSDSVLAENLSRPEVLKLGILDSNLKEFENSSVQDQGFLVEKIFENQIYHLEKAGDGAFHVKSYKSVTWSWFKNAGLKVFLVLLGLSTLAWFFTWSMGSISLLPIKNLRRTTEDILAGKFEVSSRYRAKDEIGLTFEALKRLCTELDKKDEVLEKVTQLATVDGLTGLKNHRAFKEEFIKQLSLAQRHGHSLGIAILDVDHFKKFNDTYGHQQGDEVLRVVGKTMQSTIRTTDFVARYGGEEFVAIFPQTDGEGVLVAAEKLRKALELARVSDLAKKGESLSVTASFGAVAVDGKKLSYGKKFEYTVFVEAADQNMYKAKKDGRNRVVSGDWDPSLVKQDEDKKGA